MADTFDILRELVSKVKCKPGWTFRMVDEDGALRMVIRIDCVDAFDSEKGMLLDHYFPVPTTTYNEKSWRRWIFECCRGVENHELGEFFVIDGERPFAPMHGPGENPYVVSEVRSETEARTTQDGTMR
jgi:hypothetical protein